MSTPRGIRNNNPLNIRRSKSKWLGEVPSLDGNADKSFCQFSSLIYGYRACAKLLQIYQTKYRLCELSKIIGRWAPPTENNTRSYVERVAKQMSAELGKPISASSRLDLCEDKTVLQALLVAMHCVENGAHPTLPERKAINQAIALL